MAHPEQAEARRGPALAIAFGGAFGLAVTTAFGPKALAFGALLFLIACAVALREATAPVFTWPNALAALLTIIWLIPIKLYTLPVDLGFNLEVYRLFLLILVFAWVVAGINGTAKVDTVGHTWPFLLLTIGALATQITYMRGVESDLLQTEALKTVSYFLSFLIAFLLIASIVRSVAEAEFLVKTLVIGGVLVGFAALYESSSGYNLFSELDSFIPLDREPREVFEERGGRLRVYASAQHPIALGVALVMLLPLSLYLAQSAVAKGVRRFWLGATLVIAVAAMTTVSRTTVIMLIVMGLVALRLRPKMLARYWPLLLLLPVVVHFAAPGALGGLYKSFFPKEGLVADLSGRAGQGGSGRFADVGPGFDLWSESPVVGVGLGAELTAPAPSGPRDAVPGAQPEEEIIFDNQYLNTLVTMGVVGFVGALWFIWGAAIKLGKAARRTFEQQGDLLAACSVSCVGFGMSMLTFDALSFVQCTLVFFIIAALGLRVRALIRAQPRPLSVPAPTSMVR